MIFKSKTLIVGCAVALLLGGCNRQDASGPPAVRLGDSICAECGMIISDERFATATVIDGDRGDEPMLFDDFNCQMIFESKHKELTVVDRWSHDHASHEWLHMSEMWFVKSAELHTPMASHIAAFSSQQDAEAFAKNINGETVDFETLWVD